MTTPIDGAKFHNVVFLMASTYGEMLAGYERRVEALVAQATTQAEASAKMLAEVTQLRAKVAAFEAKNEVKCEDPAEPEPIPYVPRRNGRPA